MEGIPSSEELGAFRFPGLSFLQLGIQEAPRTPQFPFQPLGPHSPAWVAFPTSTPPSGSTHT